MQWGKRQSKPCYSSQWLDLFRSDSNNWLSVTGLVVLWAHWRWIRRLKKMNYKRPTEMQIRLLNEMLRVALLEIRGLGWQGKAQQAADLADAFHNLPTLMNTDEFSLTEFGTYLKTYQRRYAETNNYLPM